ncbi:MAG: 30S ribosomal protein S8 [Spirochaetia bacterium]|nr:30S ribosomal protein S8 [Spirochaetia bacterium]
MSDIIADSLTRIRNAQRAGHEQVDVYVNGLIERMLKILKDEGFIAEFIPYKDQSKPMAKVDLKYYKNKPVIRGMERVSKPSRRVYQTCDEIKPALNNIGLNIYSTSKGIMSGKEARLQNVGGEFICKVW